MAQLRCGHFVLIDSTIDPVCPKCCEANIVAHCFTSCPALSICHQAVLNSSDLLTSVIYLSTTSEVHRASNEVFFVVYVSKENDNNNSGRVLYY